MSYEFNPNDPDHLHERLDAFAAHNAAPRSAQGESKTISRKNQINYTRTMGRELKMVPANYEHPKYTEDDAPYFNRVGQYKPLFTGYRDALKSFADDIESKGLEAAIEDHGGGPRKDDYADAEWTGTPWYQVWETVSEGTPVTPPFSTKEELIDYLTANGDFWDQKHRREPRRSIPGIPDMDCSPWPRSRAERFVNDVGWAPSLIGIGNRVVTGVAALDELPQKPLDNPTEK